MPHMVTRDYKPPSQVAKPGDARLAQLEELLSHDEWEPVEGRVQLWAELVQLLLAKPELKTYLKVPAAIEIAVYNATTA